MVALRKESVDRNIHAVVGKIQHTESLSARRAWIEILLMQCQAKKYSVALRKESVDRNSQGTNIILSITVALRKESVDRNIVSKKYLVILGRSLSARRAWIEIFGGVSARPLVACRSPQGERG